jgi:predicted CopG family antitoxin
MSKNISISDEVYERLKREKGEKSFSEIIAEKLDEQNSLAEVTGQQILDPETAAEIDAEISRLSESTLDRLDDETA